MAVISVARAGVAVIVVVGRLTGFLISLPFAHRRAGRAFYRELRARGLSRSEADRLTEAYVQGLSLRGALRGTFRHPTRPGPRLPSRRRRDTMNQRGT
ncbi:MAG: hypothetical protein AB1778_07415 [Candidatus Bipolaricaulota bacterium]